MVNQCFLFYTYYNKRNGGATMYGDALYNPMINPYMQQNLQQNPYQQQQPRQEVVKVNGENGARAFPIGANSSAILLDESGKLIWLVTTDGAGYKTVSPYDITPHQVAPAPDYSTLEQRIERLEGMIMNGTTTDTSTAWNESSAVKSEFRANQKPNERSQRSDGQRSYNAANDSK